MEIKWRKINVELNRIYPLLIVIFLTIGIMQDFSQLMVQLYNLSMVALVILVFHHIRKKMFHYIDLEEMVDLAKDNPLSASIVFASMMMFLTTMIVVTLVK